MVGVGRDLCGSPSPTPLPKKGHPEQAAQDLVQAGLEYLQRRRLHNLPGHASALIRSAQDERAPQLVYSPIKIRSVGGQGLMLRCSKISMIFCHS